MYVCIYDSYETPKSSISIDPGVKRKKKREKMKKKKNEKRDKRK